MADLCGIMSDRVCPGQMFLPVHPDPDVNSFTAMGPSSERRDTFALPQQAQPAGAVPAVRPACVRGLEFSHGLRLTDFPNCAGAGNGTGFRTSGAAGHTRLPRPET